MSKSQLNFIQFCIMIFLLGFFIGSVVSDLRAEQYQGPPDRHLSEIRR